MIVKIKEADSWHIYDGIEKVEYRPISKEEIDQLHYPELLIGADPATSLMLMEMRTKEKSGFYVVFDTVVYICNDNGKTIEKLNPQKSHN